MVRAISANAQAFLDQNIGTEPALIIEIQWVDDGPIFVYSDKNINKNEGKILSFSSLDNSVVVQGLQSATSGDSQSISVTLDDTDGVIKEIIDSHEIHKEPAWVYQWFQGLDIADKFLLFKGQISSPLQWNEGDRTVSFDIITRIEDAEVGFSMEEGNFFYVPEELVGKPWPLIFGTVKDCHALKTRTPQKGILQTGFGIADFVLPSKIEQADNVCCPIMFQGWRATYDPVGEGDPWGASGVDIQALYAPDVNCICKKRATKCELELNLAEQEQWVPEEIEIVDGDKFPQGKFLRLNINGAIVSGTFSGTTFNIANLIHPREEGGTNTDEQIIVPKVKNFFCVDEGFQTQVPTDTATAGQPACVLPRDCGGWGNVINNFNKIESVGESKSQESWSYLASFQEAGFFWADPGSEVTIEGEGELVYEANLLPSTIHYVKAWRTFTASNLRQKTTVPSSYYSVRLSNFNGYSVQEIVFDRPLSSRGEGWEDDILVTLTSSVGPNPVSIMSWLITKYTSFTIDSSFTTLATTLAKYPMNFMVPGRKNILKMLQEVAFQTRCAISLRDDEFHLTYLSEEPSADETLTESDILANSLVLDHTDSDDLVTKIIAQWRPLCDLEEPYEVILRNNVKKYGTQEETFDFYCYNIQELVIKSATFWLIRMSNTWRRVICQVPISKLALESLDGCHITLPDIGDGTIKTRVETAVYNSDDHAIDLSLLTPIRSGERTAFSFHYPASISVNLNHPTGEDIQLGNAGGSGPNVNVKAPTFHVLSGQQTGVTGFSFGQKSPCASLSGGNLFQPFCRPDWGDQVPSDTDDVAPTVPLEEDNGAVIPPTQSPVNERTIEYDTIIENNLTEEGRDGEIVDRQNNILNDGTGGSGGANTGDGAGGNNDSGGGPTDDADKLKDYFDDMPTREDLEEQNKCFYTIKVFYINVTAVRVKPGNSCGGDICPGPNRCNCNEPGAVGCFIGNQVPSKFEEFHFDTKAERDQAFISFENLIGLEATVGSPHPVNVLASQYTPEGCEGPEDPDNPKGIFGHNYGGGADGSFSVAGYHNFMLEGGTDDAPC